MSSQRPAVSNDQSTSTSVCPRCGAGFRCGMVAGDATCWCADLPPLAELPVRLSDQTGAAEKLPLSCFCPACLKSLTHPTP